TGGMTAIDRLARHRKPKNRDEAAAMDALRQPRFRVMRVEEREDGCVVRLLDLASGETLRILGEHIPVPCTGLSLVGRTAPLGGDSYALVGPITPLDEAARAVALGFMRPDGKGLSNPLRCAEAVYRHVIRHGGLEIPGLNRLPDDGREDDPFADEGEDGELDAIARHWAKLDANARPSADAIQRVRDATSLDTVLDV